MIGPPNGFGGDWASETDLLFERLNRSASVCPAKEERRRLGGEFGGEFSSAMLSFGYRAKRRELADGSRLSPTC